MKTLTFKVYERYQKHYSLAIWLYFAVKIHWILVINFLI